mgnify:CR=1 FL=1
MNTLLKSKQFRSILQYAITINIKNFDRYLFYIFINSDKYINFLNLLTY